MQQVNLFKYNGEHGCIVSPLELPMEYEPMLRLVAEANKCLKNIETGIIATVIDVYPNELQLWEEIDRLDNEPDFAPSLSDPNELTAEEFMELVEEALL
jgi:hypothetical protein